LAIRRLRLERDRTQRQFAANAGITEAALSAHERGRQLPDLRTLRLVLDALGVSGRECRGVRGGLTVKMPLLDMRGYYAGGCGGSRG
jgi:transcriptional regulator with XRE-family HTH domain